MATTYSVFEVSRVGCGKCRKAFTYKNPVVLNVTTDPEYIEQLKDMSLLQAKCSNCGHVARVPTIFLYYDPTQSILWLVTTENYVTRFLQLRNIFNSIASKYLKKLPTEEARKFNSLNWQVVPLQIFLMKIGSPLVKGKGIGYLHFYPFPRVSIDKKLSESFEPDSNIQIQQFDIGLVEGNYPDFYDTLWDLLKSEFQHGRQYINAVRIVEPKKPISTYGIPEILWYVGSNITLPIFLGTLSSLIASLILKKREEKKKLEGIVKEAKWAKHSNYVLVKERVDKIINAQDNEMLPSDKIQLNIRIMEDKQEYTFVGNIDEVYEQLMSFRREILRSVRIPGDCHMASFVGDHYVDATLEDEKYIIRKSLELNKGYAKCFKKSTRVRFAQGNEGEYLSNATIACHQARELMAKKSIRKRDYYLRNHCEVKKLALRFYIIMLCVSMN